MVTWPIMVIYGLHEYSPLYHQKYTRPGKHTKSELEHGQVEIVNLPIFQMLDLSSSLCKR